MAPFQAQVSSAVIRDQIHRDSVLPLLPRKRWGINQMTTLRWSLEEDLRSYDQMGISRIGLSRTKIAEYGDQRSAALIRGSQLKPSSVSWAGGFTGSNGFDYRESIDDAMEAIETARIVGAPLVVCVTGGQGTFTPKHGRGLVAESMKRLADRAAQLNIRLALQPMHCKFARKTSLITELADGMELLDRINHPAVGLVVDLFALGNAPDFLTQLPQIVSRCALVTLSDASAQPAHDYDRVPLGEGSLPIIPTILSLEQAGYWGTYEFQSLSEETWGMEYERVISDVAAYLDRPRAEVPGYQATSAHSAAKPSESSELGES